MAFLNRNSGRSYCDSCIRELCSLESESKVALVTATLALSPDFQRAQSLCCSCGGRNKPATRAA